MVHHASWFFNEFGLDEVLIESVGHADTEPLHDEKRDAVGKGIALILMLLKIKPSIAKEAFIDVNHVYGRAAHESVANVDTLGMMSSAVEKRDDLIEHVGTCYQTRQIPDDLSPRSLPISSASR